MSEPFKFSSGPRRAKIAIVGEAFGYEEHLAGKPFVGAAGQELTRLLTDAGINRDEVFLTNVVTTQPHQNEMWALFNPMAPTPPTVFRGLHPTEYVTGERDRLLTELAEVQPTVVVAAGNYPLWALTDHANTAPGKTRQGKASGVRVPTGIARWRGSMTYTSDFGHKTKLLPIIHPAAILRNWPARYPTKHDLKVRIPQALNNDWEPATPPTIWAPPTFDQAVGRLRHMLQRAQSAPYRVACDIETKRTIDANKRPYFQFMTCIGFCDGPNFAMSIPFIRAQTYAPFWTLTQECILVDLIRQVLTHPNILIEGQNFIYDLQYLGEYPGVYFQHDWDTMTTQHVIFPGTPKSLDYLSSLYCRHHLYWKEDNKEWDEKGDLITHLRYNAVDNLRTYEIATTQREIIPKLKLEPQQRYMKSVTRICLSMMRNGVRIDFNRRRELRGKLMAAAIKLEMWFHKYMPQDWIGPGQKTKWYNSPQQVKNLLLDMGLRIPIDRKTGNPSVGKEAVSTLRVKYPGLEDVFLRLGALRTIHIYVKMLHQGVERDGYFRTSLNPAGAETFRLSSSKNAFGRAGNAQNLPVNIKPIGDDLDDEDFADDSAFDDIIALANVD